MSYTPKTAIRLTSVPPQLCTRKELCEILGMRPTSGRAYHANKRLRTLRYTPVILNGKHTFLYNRAEVEALKYPDPPANHVNTYEAAQLLGLSHWKFPACASNVKVILRKHGLTPILVYSAHPSHYWDKTAVLAIKDKLNH